MEANRNETTMELVAEREIVITRTFEGPARVVFDAWTRADLVRRWWAPKSRGVTMASCEADVRVGGRYRYVLRKGDGPDIAFSGTYREVTPHTRLVYTQTFEMFPDGEAVITVTFDERGGRTHMVSREVYPSGEVRDMALASGMEDGMRETMDLLDELVASLA